MNPSLNEANAVLEPELRELCGELTAAQRVQTAGKFARWVDQLTDSAAITNPELIPQIPPPKVSRGFFLINLGADRQVELRKLAKECGVNLKDVLRWAINSEARLLKDKIRIARLLAINPQACWGLVVADERN